MATASRPKAAEAFVVGADVVVESLGRQGVDVIFAYPGGASMPLHQSLTKYKDKIRTILPRHEQGGASRLRAMPERPAGRACAWPRAARARLTS